MDYDTEKRKEKPKRGRRRLIRAIIVGVVICVIAGVVLVANLGNRGQVTLLPPLDDSPIVYVSAIPDLILPLELPETIPEYGVNEGMSVNNVAGNLAEGKSAFASSYAKHNVPFHTTDGLDTAWESDGSDGSWFYVDLGEATTFRILVPSMLVEGDDPTPVETYYIMSDDLKTWRILYKDVDYDKYQPWNGPAFVLPVSVTARYVGLYAQNWGGGHGMVAEFIVMP